MFKFNWIEKNLDLVKANLLKRGFNLEILDNIVQMGTQSKGVTTQINELREKSNIAARNRDIALGAELKKQIQSLIILERDLKEKLKLELYSLPNIMSDTVPDGNDDSQNIEIRKWGALHSHNAITHDEILSKSQTWIDNKEISGARFAIMSGLAAKLERILANWMLNCNVQNGFEEISIPFIVNEGALYNTGQLPKFKEDLFPCADKFLIPTGEVPLVNIANNKLFNIKELPLRLTALSHCFRKEAGSAGKDTKGLIRLHQFQKVETVSVVAPEKSEQEQEFLLNNAESLLQKLELPYRVVDICAGDIGFTAYRQFDIEVWMAGASKYVEIVSCSNCTDFQAKRMNAKFVNENKEKNYVHTLNCSALAVGRAVAAILEYYTRDGNFYVPKILKEYFDQEVYKCF